MESSDLFNRTSSSSGITPQIVVSEDSNALDESKLMRERTGTSIKVNRRSNTFAIGGSRTSQEGTDWNDEDPDIALAKAPTLSSRSLLRTSSILSAMPAGGYVA